MFSSSRQKYNSRMVFVTNFHTIDMCDFKECKCNELYSELKEAIPPNASE